MDKTYELLLKMTEIKNCRTCAHCEMSSLGASLDHCILCGEYCSIVRKYPGYLCDKNLSGWTPRTSTQYLLDNKFPIVIIGSLIFITFASLINN